MALKKVAPKKAAPKKTKKKSPPKKVTDNDFISTEKHELDYLVRAYRIPKAISIKAIKEANHSRKKAYKILKSWDYDIELRKNNED